MCGIAGWVGPMDLEDPDRTISSMVASIDHRGPDDRGWWTGPDAALGMARLAIIDLVGGEQPRFAGPWCVVFNGEIYNYREIRAELTAQGVEVTGDGDSEVVARAVQHWGADAFSRLDGMYAIAAFDRDSERFLFARDRFGEKPLYLWKRGDALAFASELRAFRPIGSMPDIDSTALVQYLGLGFVPGPHSIFQDVTIVPPGHHGEFRNGEVTLEPTAATDSRSDAEQFDTSDPVDELDRRLRASVTSRLVADVDVGVLLSGGIDSSLVAAHAAAVHPGVQSFSVAIDDPRRDESAHAAAVAQQLATRHHVITVGESDALGVVKDLAEVYDEPFADASAIPTLMLSRFVADHVKVALSGDGGDEFFSGYRRHSIGAIAPSRSRSALLERASRRASHSWWVRPQGPWAEMQVRHAPVEDLYLDQVGGLDRAWLRRLGVDDYALQPIRADARAAAADGTRWPEVMDRRLYLPGDILTKIDRASMSCGLEVRAPFLAPVVADWAAALGADTIGTVASKTVPRALVRKYFGTDLADRPKQGFSIPLARWLRSSLSDMVDLACDGHLVHSGVIDRRGVLGLRTALHRRFDRAAPALWTIAMFETWHSRWR